MSEQGFEAIADAGEKSRCGRENGGSLIPNRKIPNE